MDKGKILIVDDEADIREILQFNLENAGYEADCAASAEEVVRKELENQIPIIFLTAKNAENDLLTGFSAGGDDYISKPFSIHEVIARVKAVLRRSSTAQDPVSDMIVSGKIRIDMSKKMVYAAGEPVLLSKKEFEILSLLASHEGRVYSREDIINELWKDAPYVLDRTVDVHIARIRGKLGEYKNYLTNRSGYGYCFSPVE